MLPEFCHLPAATSNLTQTLIYMCHNTCQLPQKRRGYACAQLTASDIISNESACSSKTFVTCRRRASVNGCHRLLILIFFCSHRKMLMSLPEFCHCGRTPAAVVLSVMTDVIPLLCMADVKSIVWQERSVWDVALRI
jgi:hypothetical protein